MGGSLRRKRLTLVVLGGVVFGMIGLSFAAVPLYDLFCRVTGFGGTTQTAEQPPTEVGDRVVTVQFNSDVSSDVPWRFKPIQREVSLRVGEVGLAFYRAINESNRTVLGTATFNVTPQKAGVYFTKIDCFCFEEQLLRPGESADLPVTFFVDPEIVDDHNLDDVKTITLSYTFFDQGEEILEDYLVEKAQLASRERVTKRN